MVRHSFYAQIAHAFSLLKITSCLLYVESILEMIVKITYLFKVRSQFIIFFKKNLLYYI